MRYADDFVVLCQSKQQAQEVLTVVTHIVEKLGLQLAPDKTHITTYGKGYEFLGFFAPILPINLVSKPWRSSACAEMSMAKCVMSFPETGNIVGVAQ